MIGKLEKIPPMKIDDKDKDLRKAIEEYIN
jgi:hypothetical protein